MYSAYEKKLFVESMYIGKWDISVSHTITNFERASQSIITIRNIQIDNGASTFKTKNKWRSTLYVIGSLASVNVSKI